MLKCCTFACSYHTPVQITCCKHIHITFIKLVDLNQYNYGAYKSC